MKGSGVVSYKRPHLILSFLPHSDVWLLFGNFALSGMRLEWESEPGMNGMILWRKGYSHEMTEWGQDEGDFRIKGFALLQKYPSFHLHSVIPNHSGMMKLLGMKQKWMEWPLNDIPPLSFSFLGIQEWQGMTEWGGMMVFLEVNKKLNSEIPLILPSFCPNLT